MICAQCSQAADRHAPRDQHCNTTPGPGAACDCQHRVERYRALDGAPAIDRSYRQLAQTLQRAAPLPPMIRLLADGEDPDDGTTVIPAHVMRRYEQQAATIDAHADAVETAIARVEADHSPDDIIRIPRTDTTKD